MIDIFASSSTEGDNSYSMSDKLGIIVSDFGSDIGNLRLHAELMTGFRWRVLLMKKHIASRRKIEIAAMAMSRVKHSHVIWRLNSPTPTGCFFVSPSLVPLGLIEKSINSFCLN
jgi:hypothetical protein